MTDQAHDNGAYVNLNPLPLMKATYAATGGKILRAGRYDDSGNLLETVEADEDGKIALPTSGLWWIVTDANAR